MSVSMTDFIDSVNVVQLETNENCLISKIKRIIFFNNRYYIFDLKQQIVFCFDDSGKFLFNIDRKGQGPEEYIYLGDFNVDPYNNQLLLLEPFGHLIAFDLDGHFISKTRLPGEIKAYNEVFPLNRDELIFISLNEYSLVHYSRKRDVITDKKYKMDNAVKNAIFMPANRTYTYNNEVFFSPPSTNDIENLSDNTVFTWDFGKKNNTTKQINRLKKIIKSEGEMPEKDFVGDGWLNYTFNYNYETSRYKICALYYGKYKFRYIFFDKVTHKPYVFDATKEKINLLMPDFGEESLIMYDRGFVDSPLIDWTYYCMDMLSEEQKNTIKSNNPGTDNPFIIKYNLKK
jgi:hypothetical protein